MSFESDFRVSTLLVSEKNQRISQRHVTRLSIKYENQIFILNLYQNVFIY